MAHIHFGVPLATCGVTARRNVSGGHAAYVSSAAESVHEAARSDKAALVGIGDGGAVARHVHITELRDGQ